MPLTINQREREGVVILDLSGSLILGPEESDLRQCLRLLNTAGKNNVVLNLENVYRIDSTGLGTLIFALVSLTKAGGKLMLYNLQPAHLRLFLLTKLVTVFELFTSEQDAVDACFPDRAVERYDILDFVQHDLRPPAAK